MLEELKYFIRESGARSAAMNGISMMPKLFCRQLGFQSALAEFIGMDTKNETISVAMSNVACTGRESVLASCKRLDGKHIKCVDNIGAQALCQPSKWKLANV